MPSTQQTLYSALSPRRLRRLHRAAGAALEALPDRRRSQRAAELAWHFVLGGRQAATAVRYAVLAGDQAEAVFAHREAEQQYRTALELVQAFEHADEMDSLLEPDVRERLGRVLKTSGRYEEATEMLTSAVRMYREADDLQAAGRALAQLGLIHGLRGRPAEGIAQMEPFVALLEQGEPSHSLALLYAELVRLYNVTGREPSCSQPRSAFWSSHLRYRTTASRPKRSCTGVRH